MGGDPEAAKALALRLACLLRLGTAVPSECSMNGVVSLDRRSCAGAPASFTSPSRCSCASTVPATAMIRITARMSSLASQSWPTVSSMRA